MAEYAVCPHCHNPLSQREWVKVVRCKNCAYFFENATPHDKDCPHFCSLHGIDMAETDGFCKWGRPKEDA